MTILSLWLAINETPSPLVFAQYGVIGLVVVGFLIGWIWPKPSVDRLIAQVERQQAQLDSLIGVYENRVIPALIEVNLYLKRVQER